MVIYFVNKWFNFTSVFACQYECECSSGSMAHYGTTVTVHVQWGLGSLPFASWPPCQVEFQHILITYHPLMDKYLHRRSLTSYPPSNLPNNEYHHETFTCIFFEKQSSQSLKQLDPLWKSKIDHHKNGSPGIS